MKQYVYVIDDQLTFREACELEFEDRFNVISAEDIDDFSEKYDPSKKASAIIVDNSLGRHKAIDCGFYDWVRKSLKFNGKMILFSVSTDLGTNQGEKAKYDAVWDKEKDLSLRSLEKVLSL